MENKQQASVPFDSVEAEKFFANLRKNLQEEEKRGRDLTVEEERKMQDGFALAEMMKSAGWSIVNDILQTMPKAHIDPRGMSESDWKFAELNAFWQGQVAEELLSGLNQIVYEAHELQKIKLGEIRETKKMKV